MLGDTKIKNTLKGKRVLVTGASGYLAWNTIQKLNQFDCKIVRLSRKKFLNISHQGTIEDKTLDLISATQREITEILEFIDFIFHFGAQTSAYVANENPLEDMQQNVLPTLKLLEAGRSLKKRPFLIFAGSATQYGLPKVLPVNENHPPLPATVYCLHKLMADQYINLYTRLGWGEGCTLMLSNVYGPGPASSNSDRGILNQMIRKALNGEDLSVYGNGEQKRDYIFIEDVVDAFIAAAVRKEKASGQHFILSSGVGTPLFDAFHLITQRVEKKGGRSVKVIKVPPPEGSSSIDSRHFVGDIQAICAALDWQPKFSLQEGIDQTIEFFLEGKK